MERLGREGEAAVPGASRWLAQSRMSDPGRHAAAVATLPGGVGALIGVVQGLLVHADWAAAYGLDPAALGAAPRRTLPVAERLDDLLSRDPRPFAARRPPGLRSPGTCRDFALLLAAFLRARGIPSRVRCGFAAYFRAGWEDHWVCEHRDPATGAWRLADAQADAELRARSGTDFDPADVPRGLFLLAGEAWRGCRLGEADPEAFGHGSVTGWWFLAVNLVRDHLVLNGRETSDWDRWREAPPDLRRVGEAEMARLDALAADPGQAPAGLVPDWLAAG